MSGSKDKPCHVLARSFASVRINRRQVRKQSVTGQSGVYLQGMLMSLLPGVRHLRAPLVAGFTWLICAWLALGRHRLVPDVHGSQFETRLAGLVDLAGPGLTAAAIGVVAYLAGDLIPPFRADRHRWPTDESVPGFRLWLDDVTEPCAGKVRWRDVIDADAAPGHMRRTAKSYLLRLPETLLPGTDFVDEVVRSRGVYSPPNHSDDEHIPQNFLRQLISAYVWHRLPEMENQLMLEREVVYNEIDRQRSESEFRRRVASPIAALTIIAAVTGTYWWLSALVLPVLLVLQARTRETASRSIVVQALIHGTITSRAAEHLQAVARRSDVPTRDHV